MLNVMRMHEFLVHWGIINNQFAPMAMDDRLLFAKFNLVEGGESKADEITVDSPPPLKDDPALYVIDDFDRRPTYPILFPLCVSFGRLIH